MKLALNDSGTHYLKATFLNQVWVRYNESNPGTLVQNEYKPETLDIGLRRTRIQFFGQLSDRVFFYTQFGQNNFNRIAQNAGNRKLQAFFHDVLGEYKISKGDQLKLGGGLTITNGLSRFSQPSIGTILTMDVPIFAQATVDQTDEFSRKLSIYARGQIGKLDYRVVLSDPFPITTNGAPVPDINRNVTFAVETLRKQFQGFFIYNFLDKEPHTTPYMTGTYLGQKKVFNLEAGFIAQPDATWSRVNVASDTIYHDMMLWSVALYYDAPVSKERGTALSMYAGYFSTDYGPGYLRYNGIMNPANGVKSGFIPTSQGNAFPMFGTGDVIYAQIGYLLKKNLLGEDKGTLLPYASLMYANFDRLQGAMNVINIGINWLIQNHTSKLTLDYQHRPVYELDGNDLIKRSSRGQVVLQYQIFI